MGVICVDIFFNVVVVICVATVLLVLFYSRDYGEKRKEGYCLKSSGGRGGYSHFIRRWTRWVGDRHG